MLNYNNTIHIYSTVGIYKYVTWTVRGKRVKVRKKGEDDWGLGAFLPVLLCGERGWKWGRKEKMTGAWVHSCLCYCAGKEGGSEEGRRRWLETECIPACVTVRGKRVEVRMEGEDDWGLSAFLPVFSPCRSVRCEGWGNQREDTGLTEWWPCPPCGIAVMTVSCILLQ